MLRHPSTALTRRLFLQGAGSVIALPYLASLWPRSARAATSAIPIRYLSYFIGNGMHMPNFTPAQTGSNYTLTPILQPLAKNRADFTIVSGTANQPSGRVSAKDFGGGHGQGGASANTAAPAAGVNKAARAGISADQVVARAIGQQTRLASVQWAMPDVAPFSDLNLAPEYNGAMSWADAATPLLPLRKPSQAFAQLFPAGTVTTDGSTASLTPANKAEADERNARKKSILDAAVAQTQSLQKTLSAADKARLDQFLTGIRQVEQSLQTGTGVDCAVPDAPTQVKDLDGILDQYDDLIAAAVQCDQTRVLSFMFNAAESFRTYNNLGLTVEHHALSHYKTPAAGSSEAKYLADLQKIQTYEMQRFASLLNRLKAVPEGNGTLLDNMVIVLFSEMGESHYHSYTDMPVLVAGGGGGNIISRGQHIKATNKPEFAQVLLASIRATGTELSSFGSSKETRNFPGLLAG